MITFTYEHEESAHALSFTLSEDSTAPDVVVSFSAFMLACGYSQKTIDDAFAEMVVLDTVINRPMRTDKDIPAPNFVWGCWSPVDKGGTRKPE